MPKTTYTPEQKLKATELKNAGVSNDEIAKQVNLKVGTINKMFPSAKPEKFSDENPHLVAARSWERRQSLAKEIAGLADDDKRALLAQFAGTV
jgi:orotate phosphoribosyltransferase-like protein